MLGIAEAGCGGGLSSALRGTAGAAWQGWHSCALFTRILPAVPRAADLVAEAPCKVLLLLAARLERPSSHCSARALCAAWLCVPAGTGARSGERRFPALWAERGRAVKLSGCFRHELDVGTLFFLPSAIFFSAPLASGCKACEVAMISEMLLMRFGKKHWPSSGDCGLHGVPVTGLQCNRAVC